ncbi:hypothetical protein D9758_009704 [Tetrapyrgos nigripes]|uniref:UvrD-like helicase ATP-binding domain-containing protein n=1 Tax=Tetrapyrgos nigripes TaxID=182062 RepID=A0A8H5CPD8_9AGAR|nr:hypothetical protein D9758_009704 [Tetrapyrgos nigripes]
MNTLSILDNPSLTSVEAVDDALITFSSCLSKTNFGRVLESVADDRPRALPLILSNIDEQGIPLQKWILDSFSHQPDMFTSSLHYKLLLQLSDLFFFDSPISFDQEVRMKLSSKHQFIRKIPALLEHLYKLSFDDKQRGDVPEFQGARLTQKQRKRNEMLAARKPLVAEQKLFDDVGLDVPRCQQELDDLMERVLTEQLSLLKEYFGYLRSENVAEVIKRRFVVSTETEDLFLSLQEEAVAESDLLDETPSAYPKVQPMKSALYFDSVDGFGDWIIFVNQNAHNELRIKHKKDKDTFDIVVKKIRELSQGHFSPDNQKRLKGVGTEVPIFEAKMTSDLRLIYQVDVVAGGDEREQQAIKIFGIYTHAQMDDRLWTSIGRHLGRRGREYKERCSARIPAPNADDQTFIPASFPPLPEVQEDADSPNLLADDSNPVHSRFLMEKYVVFSQPLMNTILADVEATFPHLVSSQEKVIIEHPYSCYVIGRSGTGKTTTLLFKMLLIERTAQLAGGDAPRPRQIFVTQSRVLAKKVEEYFATLVKSLTATNQSLEELRNLKAAQHHLSLDEEDDDMIHMDDIIDWTGDLPSKFSELQDEHFPLFTTFDNLCLMLEADIADLERAKKALSTKSPISATPPGLNVAKTTVLTYDDFLRITGLISLNLLLNVLIQPWFSASVIKGSEETLSSDSHYLTCCEYLNMSSRSQSTFADNRESIYTLFKAYLDLKKKQGHKDGADRTRAILDSFSAHGTPGQKVDHLYVDEVQDNLLVDTLGKKICTLSDATGANSRSRYAVLRALCHDPNGLFWAGDTAQTISVGSSFRFNALKAFQWRLEEKRSKDLDPDQQRAVQPEIFQLAVNYRSHAGIVNCAHSVVDLISRFWKDSIDKLSPEKGVVDGLKPVFFVGWDEDSAGLEHFIFGDSGSRIEFGAQQCILVRDNDAREKLRKLVGEGIGLIMTIYESKGLEFNDVLLYDFFSDSPAELSQWRVILGALEEDGTAIPDFERNRSRYASICSELKFLYVAVTRARENIWIVDSSLKSGPMRHYWTKKDLIRNLTPGMNAPRLATSSTPEEWAKQGKNLFQRKKYVEAKHCFERALLPDRVAITHAYILRTKAQAIRTDTKADRQNRKRMFSSAAEAFRSSAKPASRKIRLELLRLSGDCYKNADELLVAAQIYRDARRFTDSVSCYRDVNHFDEAIDIVKKEANSVDPDTAAQVIRLAKLFYFNQVQGLAPTSEEHGTKLHQACALFDDVENVLDYLGDRDLDVARAAVLAENGRYEEAAQLCLEEGRTLEAIELLLRVPSNKESAQRARDYILKGLWDHLSFGVVPVDSQSSSLVSRLLELASKASNDSTSFNAEVSMFRAILEKSTTQLRLQAKNFLEAQNIPAAILCLDHYFSTMPRLTDLSVSDVAQQLEAFLDYTQLLSTKLLADKNPQDSRMLQKLFAFERLSEGHVRLAKGSYLHMSVGAANSDQDFMLPSLDLLILLRNRVGQRVRNRILKEDDECKRARAFSLCLNFSTYGGCLELDVLTRMLPISTKFTITLESEFIYSKF